MLFSFKGPQAEGGDLGKLPVINFIPPNEGQPLHEQRPTLTRKIITLPSKASRNSEECAASVAALSIEGALQNEERSGKLIK